MTNNPTIDGVSRDALNVLRETFKFVLDHRKQPTFSAGDARFFVERLSAILDARPAIDLDAADWSAIQQAASESTWIPPEYYRNDWVSDVCEFLRNGAPAVERQEQPYGWVATSPEGLERVEAFTRNADIANQYRDAQWLVEPAFDAFAVSRHSKRLIEQQQSTIAQLQARIGELESGSK